MRSSITFFFFLAGIAAAMIRLELVTPAGDLMSAETYNKAFTFHGVVMVWFFLIPSIPATLGNFLLPMMIGARDVAFPRLNLFSWYLYMVGGVFTIACLLLGGVDTGWTFYTPFSTMFSNTNVMLTVVGRVHRRLLLDPHRAQLHRHHAHACARRACTGSGCRCSSGRCTRCRW